MSHGGVGWEHLSVPYAAPYWEREMPWEAEWAQTHQGHHSLAAPLLSQPGAVPWTRSIPSVWFGILEVLLEKSCSWHISCSSCNCSELLLYICLTFLTCFRFQTFRYLMQNNKGEKYPLTSHLSSSREVLIPGFHGDRATGWFVEVHTSLSAIRAEMLKERPM